MASRASWKEGRFSSEKFGVKEIHEDLRAWQSTEVYDEVQYYRFDGSASQSHPIFSEGYGVGKIYRPPVTVPVLHANHDEGGQEFGNAEGFYFNDNVYLTASFDQLYRTGLVFQDIRANKYLKDRFVYDTRVFRVISMSILGQVRERDTIVTMAGTQCKPDELVNDPQFVDFLNEGPFTDGRYV